MKILILGKNGQLGQELEKEAKNREFDVLAMGHEEIDVTSYGALKTLLEKERPNILINATAYNNVREADTNYEKAFEINCFSVFYMAKICREIGTKFVTFSTDYVFDGTKNAPYSESDEVSPLQIYGLSKALGEIAASNANKAGTIIIRTCAVYGGKEGSREKRGNIVLSILKLAKEKEYLEMAEDQFVNPTYSKDLSKATFALIEKNPEPGIYHLASEGFSNWYEFAKECLKIADIKKEIRKISIESFAKEQKKPKFTVLSNNKAKKLGIVLPIWQESLRNYILDFKLK